MHNILQEDSRHAQYITRGRETYCSSARAYYSNFIIRLLSLCLHTPRLIRLGPVSVQSQHYWHQAQLLSRSKRHAVPAGHAACTCHREGLYPEQTIIYEPSLSTNSQPSIALQEGIEILTTHPRYEYSQSHQVCRKGTQHQTGPWLGQGWSGVRKQ